MTRLVGEVGEFFTTAVPDTLDRIDAVEGLIGTGSEAHIVKNKELWLGANIDSVTHAGRLQISLSFLSNEAWVTAVTFTGNRINDITDQAQGRYFDKGVDLGCIRLRDKQHIGLVNRLPATD